MRKQSQLSSNYSCIDFYVYVSLSLLLSWWHREGHNYLCSIELVSNSKPWWNIKQKLLLLLQKVLLTLEISLEEQCKNTRIHRKKGYKKIFKNPAHHSGVPSLCLPKCHQICHHYEDRPVWEPCRVWCRVESPYRTRPSSKCQNKDDEGLCGCAIPMLKTECMRGRSDCSAQPRKHALPDGGRGTRKLQHLYVFLIFTLYVCTSVLWQPPKTNRVMEIL